jgi:putative PEP-CTERM system TPR-repeat lipoprotein
MKPINTALALALAASLLACANDEPAAVLASAKQYMEKRDFNASVIQLKNVLQKAPEHPEARYLLGVALLEQGDPVAAQIELDKAVALGFSSDELQVALARVLLARGGAAKMLEQFGATKLATPKAHAELGALIGMAQLARGERRQAQQAFEEALALDAANTTANLGTALLAAAERNFAAALSAAERALAAAPTSLEALLFKANLYAVQGEHESAEQGYRKAIAAAPNQVAPRMSLISHLLRQRVLDKADAEAAALEKMAPKDPRMFYAKALVLIEERKFAAAREAVQQVLKVAPEHVPSLTVAGMAALETGALQEAESHLRKAVLNAPNAFGAKRLLAMTHLRMGKTELALSEVGELLKVSQDPAIIALAGEAHLAKGDVAGAARHYEQAKALAPKNAAVQTRLGLIRLAAGDADRAIAELEAASTVDPSAYQADLALITTYLRKRDPDNALEALKTLEKKQPNNPLTHNLRGGALLLKKDFTGARKSFERALELQPTYMPAVSNLAQLDLRDKKPEAARKRYEAVLKKEPNNEQALLGLAVLLRVAGANPQEIEKPLKQSVAANPASPNARAALINFYLRNRDDKAALAAAQEAQAALPNHAGILQALGATQMGAGETRQAVATFTRLAEMLPKSHEPHILLARAHVAGKQPDEAIKSLRAALALRPDLAAAQRDIVAIYVAANRHDDALREAKAVQAEQPQQPLGHVLEAELYVAQKKWDLAERTYRAALKKFDTSPLAVRTHAVMHSAGKAAEADAMAEDWVKRHPKDALVIGYLAERDLAAKRYESAAKGYRSALERQPDNALFLNNLAWVSNQLKEPRALEYAERAHELAPDNPNIMDTLGFILAETGQIERGLELLGRASELAPNAHQIRLNFAKALVKAQKKAAARKELEQLAKLDARLPVQQEAAKLLEGL